MKKSELSFFGADVFAKAEQAKGNTHKMFDFEKAAEIIKDRFSIYPDLVAEAGLQGDWTYTGGEIFADGKPTNESYTYLASNWAKPTLILSYHGQEQEELDCFKDGGDAGAKWDEKSLAILGINL